MIDYANTKTLIAKANAIYVAMLEQGDWSALDDARRRSGFDDCSPSEIALRVVAECRNPSPIQDIPDLRRLVKKGESSVGVGLEQYFVAVQQTMFNYRPEFNSGNALS